MPLQATSGAASYDAFGGNGVAIVPKYIEDYLGLDNMHCLTILEIFQAPFSEIRKNSALKIKENSFSLNQGFADYGN